MATDSSLRVLSHAVRFPVVLRYLGELLLALAALTLVPFAVALAVGEPSVAWRLVLVSGGLAAIGAWGARRRAAAPVQPNEAMVVTALAYLAASLVMVYPFMAAGIDPIDAWFEAVSGVTTTGLSTLGSVEALPRSLLFARAWMQWYGGLGIVVLTATLLSANDVSARRLVLPAESEENLVTTTRVHARRMLVVYLLLSGVGIGVLLILGLGAFDAVCHTLAAISTGGFATHDASLAAFDGWAVRGAVLGIAFCGAVALPLYYRARHESWRVLVRDEELRLLTALTLVVALLLFLLEFGPGGASADAIGHSLLTAVSAQTTTGFATYPAAELNAGAKAVLLFAMASGGSLGSTAGGFKLLRLLMLGRLLRLWLRRFSLPPHAVADLRIGGHRVESDEALRGIGLILVFILTVLASWIPFLAYGYDPLDALFDVVSATATTGLSTGVVSTALESPLKVVLCLDMLLGRLEFMAVLILFFLPTWWGQRGESK